MREIHAPDSANAGPARAGVKGQGRGPVSRGPWAGSTRLVPGRGRVSSPDAGADGKAIWESELHRASADAKAERIIAEELKRYGWMEADLAARRKTDPRKLEIAARLRRETTLPLKAIAHRVNLGTSKAANARLHVHMRERSGSVQAQPQLGI